MMKIVLLTGYSGSGKSSALRYIEEHGYYCVDNLPGKLLEQFTQVVHQSKREKVAVVIDARGRDFMLDLEKQIDALKKIAKIRIVFFESDLASITKRFSEHRLRHPLSLKGTIKEGFDLEKQLLSSLRQRADLVLNTSGLNVHSLKTWIHKHILGEHIHKFEVHLTSFGFKYGIPHEVDILIDVRHLINPFFEPSLKRKTGKNQKVKDYILQDTQTKAFLDRTHSYLSYLLKKFKQQSKPFVTIGFGCTGGRHRSVFVAEWMKTNLQEKFKRVKVGHRDILLD